MECIRSRVGRAKTGLAYSKNQHTFHCGCIQLPTPACTPLSSEKHVSAARLSLGQLRPIYTRHLHEPSSAITHVAPDAPCSGTSAAVVPSSVSPHTHAGPSSATPAAQTLLTSVRKACIRLRTDRRWPGCAALATGLHINSTHRPQHPRRVQGSPGCSRSCTGGAGAWVAVAGVEASMQQVVRQRQRVGGLR